MNHELKQHIRDSLKKGVRLDGRKLDEYREIKIEKGVSKSAEGSARVRIGETDVMVGVKMEVGEPYPDTPDQGTIIVGAELLPLSNPEFEGGPPGIEAIELARVVDRGIRESKLIDFKGLCVEEGKKVWMILIDICTINDAGNLFDASALASFVALKDSLFPKYDDEKVDYKEKTGKRLPMNDKQPLSVTVIKIGDSYIVDPTIEEEKALDARLTVAAEKDGTLCAMQKGGDIPLAEEDVDKMIDIALNKCNELRKLL